MIETSSGDLGMRRTPKQTRSQERVDRILNASAELFVTKGYSATTTNAIATRAKVSIGSLYQFFPDKAAILQALARHYGELLRQRLSMLSERETVQLPLVAYVDWLVDTTDQFFTDHPGYHAIFMEAQGMVLELEEIGEATDALLVQDLATALARRDPGLERTDYEAISFVLVKAIGTLLWLAPCQERLFRQRLVVEAKRMTLNYLESYFSPIARRDA